MLLRLNFAYLSKQRYMHCGIKYRGYRYFVIEYLIRKVKATVRLNTI